MIIRGGAFIVLCVILSIQFSFAQQQKESICLIIRDFQTKESLPGVVIRIDEGKYLVSDNFGRTCFNSLSKDSISVEISSLGYATKVLKISPTQKLHKLFLSPKAEELSEVLVTSPYSVSHQTSVATVVSGNELKAKSGENLGKVLESVAGVSLIQTGATIVKPVIQGMHSNRIIIANNGVRLESQQWGADHAPEIDPNIAQSIEVVKGAEAVRYGADAMGGVILIKPSKLPYGEKLQGKFNAGYATNGRGITSSATLEGKIPSTKHFAWRIQSSIKKAGDMKTADYFINNTGIKELNFSGAIGYERENFGTSIYYSRFSNELGIFYGAHIGNLDDLKQRFEVGYPSQTFPYSSKIEAPKQKTTHDLFRVSGFWKPSFGGHFKWQYAYQSNQRKEFNVRRLDRTKIPALHMELTSHIGDISWEKEWKKYWKSQLGFSYISQENYNKPGTGVVPVIPNFASRGLGFFAIQEFKKDKWEVQGGARFDYKNLHADGFDRNQIRYGGRHKFKNLTYSIGAAYQATEAIKIRSNLGMAWRAPHVNELYSNGLHHGAGTFDLGDKDLKSETGVKWINSFQFHNEKVALDINFFLQYIKNYIYDKPMGETRTLFSGVYPIFTYIQSDGFFRGGDISLNYAVTERLNYKGQVDLIYADDIKEDGYFPFIAPLKLTNELIWKIPNNSLLKNTSISINHHFTGRQNRYEVTQELPLLKTDLGNLRTSIVPDAYHLFGFSANTSINFAESNTLTVYLLGENILNTKYKDYTNRFRYYAHDLGRNIQLKITLTF